MRPPATPAQPAAPTGRRWPCSRTAATRSAAWPAAISNLRPGRASRPSAPGSVADCMSRRILVIDDSELIREVAKLALGRAGWETLTAEDGESGIATAAAEQPDAILLD